RFVGNIKNEATRLVSLINDIIRLSQLDEDSEPATESVDLYDVANEVIEALTVSAAKKQVELHLNGESCVMNGIRRYLYEIIYNLCDNAIRYNKDGGKVTVDLQNKDGNIILSVSDTGIGIPTEHQSRIFERFYRVDKSHSKETGGTGLGLSIVKHAVAYHGGTIRLESKPQEGTTIIVEF
ncbi:MAG: ATP-binding protein, partial [Candidatus Fimenecus sp.]|nr:ATP-binding protein [Candidatus Fimenecus sp.]